MKKFESITKYLSHIDEDNFSDWIADTKSKGAPEDPIQMPYVVYSDMASNFNHDIYNFVTSNEDMGLNRYGEILEQYGLEWSSKSMANTDISQLDGQCIMALLFGAARAERFCDGFYSSYLRMAV